MSGHSKWATTHRQKEAVDAKRGAIFTKLANAISIAARSGGDPEMNPSLRSAIDKAREANMPKNNIERAIKKGTGELAGEQVEELYYEGIGPANVQFMIKCLTANKNRSAATIRHLFTKNGGSLGAVKWNFDLAGMITIELAEIKAKKVKLEDLELRLIDQGIIDFKIEDNLALIQTNPSDLNKLVNFLETYNLILNTSAIEYVAKEKQAITSEQQGQLDKFMEDLEDNEDVNDYYHNIA